MAARWIRPANSVAASSCPEYCAAKPASSRSSSPSGVSRSAADSRSNASDHARRANAARPRSIGSSVMDAPAYALEPALSAGPLEPASPAEQDHEGDEHDRHQREDQVERIGLALTRELHVHPEDARDEGQWQEHDAGRGEDPERVVQAMGQHRLVRRLEPFDDLLVVLERVPDPLRGIRDVIEVDLELFLEVALLGPLEVTEHRALGTDDLAEVDDLLLRVRQLAHDLRGAALEDVVLQALELECGLAQ